MKGATFGLDNSNASGTNMDSLIASKKKPFNICKGGGWYIVDCVYPPPWIELAEPWTQYIADLPSLRWDTPRFRIQTLKNNLEDESTLYPHLDLHFAVGVGYVQFSLYLKLMEK